MSPPPPLKLNQVIRLDQHTNARFDGMHIIIETLGVERVRITALAMARLWWMAKMISEDFPKQFMVDMEEALKLDDLP